MNKNPNPINPLIEKLKVKPVVKPPSKMFINIVNEPENNLQPPKFEVEQLEPLENIELENVNIPPSSDINDVVEIEIVPTNNLEP